MLTATVLKCELHDNDYQASHKVRIVKDYEFDYYLNEGRTLEQNGELYKPSAGTLVYRRPGDIAKGAGIFHCYMLTLDFSGKKKAEKYVDRETEVDAQPLYDLEPLNSLPAVISIYHTEECNYLMKRLMALTYPKQLPETYHLTCALVSELIYLIASDYNRYQAQIHSPASSRFLKICHYIQTNYQEDLDLTQFANMANLEKSYFSREFKKEIRNTPMEYVINIRLENAKFFLVSTDYSLREISELCGFHSEAYFCSCFKNAFGSTPSTYKKLNCIK